MKELTVLEMEMVGGAGLIQKSMAQAGSKICAALWSTAVDVMNIELNPFMSVCTNALAPQLGEQIGSELGGQVEKFLFGLPYVGSIFNTFYNE